MPLRIANSLQIGPRAPNTLAEYLTSIGCSWFGGFRAGQNQYSISTDQLTPANTEGASVGQWVPKWTAGGFAAKFTQPTNAKRPTFSTLRGVQGILGDATSTFLALDSTTALNRDYTVLIAASMQIVTGQRAYSHNLNRMSLTHSNSGLIQHPMFRDNAYGVTVPSMQVNTPYDASTSLIKCGWPSTGTGHFNNAPNLLRASTDTNYSGANFTEIWFVNGTLTNNQIANCLAYLNF